MKPQSQCLNGPWPLRPSCQSGDRIYDQRCAIFIGFLYTLQTNVVIVQISAFLQINIVILSFSKCSNGSVGS
jgi:hypothetical protein